MTPHSNRILLAASVAGALFAATPARAQTALERSEGERRYAEGVALHNQDKEEEALVKFRQAYAVYPSANTLFSVARTEQLANRAIESLQDFRKYEAEPGATPAGKESARQHIEELAHKIVRLTLQAPSDATVTLDGRPAAPDTKGELDALPGAHVVQATRRGRTEAKNLSANAGETVTLAFFQETALPPVPPSLGLDLGPTSKPAAASPAPMPPPVEQDTHARAGLGLWLPVGLGAGALVLLGTSIYFGAKSNSDADGAGALRSGPSYGCLNSTSAACASLQSDVSSSNSEHVVSIVTMSAAGVFAAGAVASWFLLAPKSSSTSSDRQSFFAPIVAPGTMGAQWLARF